MLIADISFRAVLPGKSVRASSRTPFAARMGAMVDVSRLILSMDVVCSSTMSVQIPLRSSASISASRFQTFVRSLVAVDVFVEFSPAGERLSSGAERAVEFA